MTKTPTPSASVPAVLGDPLRTKGVAFSYAEREAAAGNGSGITELVRVGGYTGLILAALAAYLSAAAVFEAAYGREVLPVGDRSKQ